MLSVRPPALVATYKRLSIRERLMLALALLGAIYFVFEQLLIQPELERQQILESELATARNEKLALAGVLAARAEGRSGAQQTPIVSSDPDAQERQRLLQMARTLDALNAQAQQNGNIHDWLDRLPLTQAGGVVSLSIRVQPAAFPAQTAYRAPEPAPDGVMTAPEWRPVELVLEGQYAELMAFIVRLQQRPGLRWRSASLRVTQHPQAQLSLSLHVALPATRPTP